MGNYTLRWNVLHNACEEINVCVSTRLTICSAMKKRTRYIRVRFFFLYLWRLFLLVLFVFCFLLQYLLGSFYIDSVSFTLPISPGRNRSFDFCFYFTTSLTAQFLFTLARHGYSYYLGLHVVAVVVVVVIVFCMRQLFANVFKCLWTPQTEHTYPQCLSYVQFHVWHCFFFSSFSSAQWLTKDWSIKERG